VTIRGRPSGRKGGPWPGITTVALLKASILLLLRASESVASSSSRSSRLGRSVLGTAPSRHQKRSPATSQVSFPEGTRREAWSGACPGVGRTSISVSGRNLP